MENEAVSSIKISITLSIISLLIFSILIIVNIIKPVVYDKTLSIVNIADEEYEKRFEDYNNIELSGTKVIRVIRECDDLGIGIIYQTYEMKENGEYAKNIGTIFDGAITYDYNSNNKHLCDRAKIINLASWKISHHINRIFYTSHYFKKDDDLVACKNYVSAIFSKSSDEYIALDGRFYSELIKDSTEKVIGIVFTQL